VVNSQSEGRWNILDNSGKKMWMLSNTCHSLPKAWICGCKYWNHENDELITKPFNVNGPAEGLRVSFFTRWKVLEGDFCYVQYRVDGGQWTTLATYTGGQNASYPVWDKQSYALPAVQDEGSFSFEIRFLFTSDASGVDWGWGVDDVSVYQRLPEPPINLTASDGEFFDHVQVDWQDSGDYLTPDGYFVYRADAEAGPYNIINFVSFGTTTYDDSNVTSGTTYWYKVTAVKDFVGESRFSNDDSGFANAD